ncbi:MAG: isochorismate synthase [Bacteroidetes bacterium]|jgi:isochorismate synthase|nr:isochorismate synthase [Bacteroidota bacterium]
MGLNTKCAYKGGIHHLPVSQILQAFLTTAVRLNLPVVFYQCPNNKQIQAIIGNQLVSNYRLTIEKTTPGFVFSPFNNFSNNESYFVPADILYSIDNQENSIQVKNNHNKTDQIFSELSGHLNDSKKQIDLPGFFDGCEPKNEIIAYPNYANSVDRALKEIQNGSFKKVVLGQKKDIPIPHAIDPIDVFLRLCSKYQRAFVSLVSLPEVGTWLGSSPETLLKIDGEKLQTVALAGTKTLDQAEKDDVWTNKEYEEQEFVVQNIHDSFVAADISNYFTNGPETVQAGSLIHLKTVFEANIHKNQLYKATSLLEQIHPTSAVCGTPKSDAHQFIKENEPFSREFYAGYLGTTNINSTLDLYVNLRCARFFHDHISLFAGSGITAGSKPELENQEIQLKFLTIEKVIKELFHSDSEILTNSWHQNE